jgi:large subunit ribosomal protein L22
MMESENFVRAHLRKIRVSPRKLNLLAQAIRGKKVEHALKFLRFSRKRVALDVYKTLRSAVANAENNHHLDVDNLFVKEAYVGKSIVLKRFHARGRGRGNTIHKPFSHLSLLVAQEQ